MTEAKIFEILLQKQYDFPKLNEEAAATVATSFTDIIYDTLKLKSSLPTSKRLNVLKFINTLALHSDTHVDVNEKNYHTFIRTCEEKFESDDLNDFLKEVGSELKEKLPGNLSNEVREFYKKRNEKRQRNIKKLELIQQYDQETVDQANFFARISRSISYYETSENLIKRLLPDSDLDKSESLDVTNFSYREKQIKFAYAVLHLRQWLTLKKILERLRKYESLSDREINFLIYLNEHISSGSENLREFLVKNFAFIYEKCMVEFCSKIIQLEDNQIPEFLETLLFDKKYLVIKELCGNELFRLKIKHLVFELYSYSFCNHNLLKFVDFLM